MDEKDCEVTDSSSGKLTSLLELSEKVESVQEVPAIVLGMPQETTGSPFEESGSSTFDEGQIEVDDDGFLDELFEGYGNMDLGSGSH